MTIATITTTLADDGAMDGEATRQFAAALGVRAGHGLFGTAHPAHIANIIALELGFGDGESGFYHGPKEVFEQLKITDRQEGCASGL